jgi:hypothetical protein
VLLIVLHCTNSSLGVLSTMPTVQKSKSADGGGGAFLTQKGEKMNELKKDIADLEQLLATTSQTSQSTQLLKKRKEMKEVDNALELMKSDYKRRMDECEERRISFEAKQGKMRDQVLKFEKFIQENDSKRMRAESKAKAERKLYVEKMEEIEKKKIEHARLEREQLCLKKEFEFRRCFRDYLEKVVEQASTDMTYEEVPEVLNRYDVLTAANDDLVNVESAQDAEVDEYRKKLQALMMESNNIELTRNSQLQNRQKQLERLRNQAKLIETNTGVQMDKEKTVQREWGAVDGAIRNVYSRCCATMRNQPLFPPPSTATDMEILEFDLDVMWTRIRDLIDIRAEFKDYKANDYDSFSGMDGGLDGGNMSASTVVTGINANASIAAGGSTVIAQGSGTV